MEKIKLPTQLTNTELLELLQDQSIPITNVPKQTAVTPEDNKPKDIYLSFITAFNLGHGENLVDNRVLFSLFKEWYGFQGINKRKFIINMGKFLLSEVISNKVYFKINTGNTKIQLLFEKTKDKKIKKRTLKNGTTRKRIEKWLLESNIRPGNIYVEHDLLNYLYDTWCYNRNLPSSNSNIFLPILKLTFKHKKIAPPHGHAEIDWIGVNEEIYKHLNEEIVWNWRHGREKKKKFTGKTIPKNRKKNAIFPEVSEKLIKIRDELYPPKRKVKL